MRARVVDAHDDLLPYRPVILHLGVLPLVPNAVRVRVVLDHGGDRAVPGRGWMSAAAERSAGCSRDEWRDRPGDAIDPNR